MSTIPQEVLDFYNRNYRNGTYTAFSARLKRVTAGDTAYGDAFEQMIMHLLIDSSLERSGAAFYKGAEHSLMRLIRPLSTELVTLAQAHLSNFGPSPKQRPSSVDQVWTQLAHAQVITEDAVCLASDLSGWRGRTAYAWANAAAYLLQAASAFLLECRYDDYLLEKLDRGLQQLQNGVIDAQAKRVAFASDFVRWIRELVKARY
jgi:hypothetical protein